MRAMIMNRKIKVLIVDDSMFMRYKLRNIIDTDERFEIAGEAADGIEAIELLPKLKPDVVTMDIEMPVMGGLETLKRLMAEMPVPVVMISVLTTPGAEATLESLRFGAVDFIPKGASMDDRLFKDLLLSKLYAASSVDISILCRRIQKEAAPSLPHIFSPDIWVIVIGCSTGGPRALYHLIPQFPEDVPASIFIVQHMPVGFTKHLASRLNDSASIRVKEAEQGEHFERGVAYIAPAGSHMLVGRGAIRLTKEPPVNGVRPAADITMKSLAKNHGTRVIGAVLTGMGKDGTAGAYEIRKAGGKIFAEAESSCVIFGMPKNVIERGYCDKVVPLEEMGQQFLVAMSRPSFTH